MKKLCGLVAVALFAANISGVVQAAPPAPAGQATAIAVDGDYVYVVENGAVYKLNSKDLKPVATTRLHPATGAKPAAKARKTGAAKRRRKSRASGRRKAARARTTWRRVPVKTAEAGLPG